MVLLMVELGLEAANVVVLLELVAVELDVPEYIFRNLFQVTNFKIMISY